MPYSMHQKIIKKLFTKEEFQIIKWAKSVVSTQNLKKGDILTDRNISVKRPCANKYEIPANFTTEF